MRPQPWRVAVVRVERAAQIIRGGNPIKNDNYLKFWTLIFPNMFSWFLDDFRKFLKVFNRFWRSLRLFVQFELVRANRFLPGGPCHCEDPWNCLISTWHDIVSLTQWLTPPNLCDDHWGRALKLTCKDLAAVSFQLCALQCHWILDPVADIYKQRFFSYYVSFTQTWLVEWFSMFYVICVVFRGV